jgi:ketopantoate hydroxymethyltransferase
MLTSYDMYTAATFDEAGIEVLLVGDSASNNVYGNETSLPVDEMRPAGLESIVSHGLHVPAQQKHLLTALAWAAVRIDASQRF